MGHPADDISCASVDLEVHATGEPEFGATKYALPNQGTPAP